MTSIVRSPRLVERRRAVRAERRRRRRRIVASLLILSAIGAGAWRAGRSTLFDLSRVEVVGARSVPERTIVVASGLRIGQSVLAIDPDEIASRIERLGQIRDASVVRSGVEIRILVTERKPVAEVRTGASRWLTDEDGQTYLGKRPRGARLPIIRLGVGTEGTREVISVRQAVASSMAVWTQMPRAMRARVGWFEVQHPSSIIFTLDRIRVAFGDATNVSRKLSVLGSIEDHVRKQGSGLRSIDIRSPKYPAVRMV